MLAILNITLPLFLLIGVGYACVRRGPFTPDHVRGMGAFVINVALPALIFRLLSRNRLQDLIEWRYFLVYATGSLVMLLGSFLYWRRAERLGRPSAAIRSFGMAASNSGFIGMPVATQFLGPHVGIAVGLTFVVENLLMLPGLLILGQEGGAGRRALARQIGRGLVRSPLIVAIVAAVLSLVLGVQPIAPLAKALDLLAAASAPVALFVIGGSLVGIETRGMLWPVFGIGAAKLLLHPLAIFVMLQLVPVADPVLRHGALLLAAVPMASSYPIFGQRYGEGPLAAAALLVTTASAFVTLNIMLWLLRSGLLG